MRCPDVETLLSAYEDDALNAHLRERVEVHLTTCAACQRTLREMRAMTRLLAEPLSHTRAPSDFVHRIMQSLPSPAPQRSLGWGWKIGTVSAAVALLLTFALWQMSQRRERHSHKVAAIAPKALPPKQEREPQRMSPPHNLVPKSPSVPRPASPVVVPTGRDAKSAPRLASPRPKVVVRQVAPPVTFSVRWDDRRVEQQQTITTQVAETQSVVVERPPLVAESPMVRVTTDAESIESANGSGS